jgi:hypothetical protein
VTRVGLISDTHGLLRNQVFERFAGVKLILHAGDVGDLDILAQLAALAPVRAVYGNTDGFAIRGAAPAQVALELEGWKLLVTHGHELGSPKPAALRKTYPAADIIIYGHTHVPLVAEHDGTLIVNPGAAGPARFDLKPGVALLELAPGQRAVQLTSL